MNIYEKMLKATDSINKVAKNLNVGIGQNQYKAVGEADVLEAVKPVEIELGIYSYPFSRKIVETNVFTTTSEYKGEIKEKNTLFLRLETVYRFINVEDPMDFIDITTYGDGVDPQDKAPGKAMTYSDKYALLKAYKIETGDDPDQKASESMKKGNEYKKKDETLKKPVDDEHNEEVEALKHSPVDKVQIATMQAEMMKKGINEPVILEAYKITTLSELNKEQFVSVMKRMEKTPVKATTDLGL